jgi:tetratricopeptide (TPR) repeat protein
MTLIRFSTMLLALAVLPAPVVAQAKCEIEEGKPGQVKDASNALAKATLPIGKPEDKLKSMQQAVTLLTKDETKINSSNPTGRAFVLGRAFTELATQPNNLQPVARGSIGLTTAPEEQIDLVSAVDSMFDIVEAAKPECRDETEQYRRKVYAALVNDAVNQYNARQTDSAGTLARRGLSVYDGYRLSYIAYQVLGNVQQTQDSIDAAIASFKKMTELMKGDTSVVEERKGQMLNIASLIMAQGESADSVAKVAKMKAAAAYLEDYLKEFPADTKAEAALARAQMATGDTSVADRIFGAMVSNPEKYSDSQLVEAGVNAARADRAKDAAALFEAGLKKNPYSRDGLFNLAVTLDNQDAFDRERDVLMRLTAIDPENPENYRLWARFFQNRARGAKEAAAKKPATSPEAKEYAAVNDSLLKYFQRFQEAPVRVSFNLWSHDGAKHVLGGSIENLSDAQKSYTLKLEFLDATGKVVATKEQPVEAVAAKGAKSFRIEVEGEGIIAFRYAPFGP